MPKYYAKKDGRVYNVYTTPFTKWEEPPEDFPQTFPGIDNLGQLHQNLGTSDVVVIDRPKSDVPQVPDQKIPLGMLAGILGAMNLPEALQDQLKTRNSEANTKSVDQEVRAVREASDLQDKILQEFRVLVAGAASTEIEAVGSFLLSVCPDLEADLHKIVRAPAKKRFTCE